MFEKKTENKELQLKDLGNTKMLSDAMNEIYPEFPLNLTKEELLDLLNDAGITHEQLDYVFNSNIRKLTRDNESKPLDYTDEEVEMRNQLRTALERYKVAA